MYVILFCKQMFIDRAYLWMMTSHVECTLTKSVNKCKALLDSKVVRKETKITGFKYSHDSTSYLYAAISKDLGQQCEVRALKEH